MMISPDGFYRREIDGKTPERIRSVIRGLKQQIGYLKKRCENKDDCVEVLICPSNEVQISCTRAYIRRAILALYEMGESYQCSKAEARAMEFNDSLCDITRIEYAFGSWMDTTIYNIKREGEVFVIEKRNNLTAEFSSRNEDCNEFLDELENIWIGEWKRKYVNPGILDGDQWELTFYMKNGKKYSYYGSNKYPYNYEQLKQLICGEDYYSR